MCILFRKIFHKLKRKSKKKKKQSKAENVSKPLDGLKPASILPEDDKSEVTNISDVSIGITPRESRDQAPQVELPIGFRYNPFSKSTYYPRPTSNLATSHKQPKQSSRAPCQPFRILDLPAELRLKIIAYYVGNKRIRQLTLNGLTTLKRRSRSFVVNPAHHINDLSILRTNRQLNREAGDILWDGTTFIVKVRGYNVPADWVDATVPNSLLSTMRHAIFDIDFPSLLYEPLDFYSRDHVLNRLLAALPRHRKLRTVELHFDFGGYLPSQSRDSESVQIQKVDSFFGRFLELPVAHLTRISSVRLFYEDVWNGHQNVRSKKCVPFTERESYRELRAKFGNALDVSDQQCGCDMPCLNNGAMETMNTSVLSTGGSS